ncbi:hypothetical protein HBI55_249250 [Parastagonospora nodorum]|nr:hypothetical protein HBI55_249250 [Parastagonospora nodorum]
MHKPSFHCLIQQTRFIKCYREHKNARRENQCNLNTKYTCQSVARRLQECIRTADARRIVRSSENSAPASPLVHSDHALQECSPPNMCSDLRTHVIRQARIEVTAAYALNHLELQVLKLSKLLQDFVYLRQDPRNIS